jgi:hypothetical protein
VKNLSSLIVAVFVLTISAAAIGAEKAPDGLDPKRTHGIIIGVLEFKDSATTGWPKRARKDQELFDRLIALGVPKANLTLLLDSEATRASILKAVGESVEGVRKGDTLIFYYAGHGSKDGEGKPYLIPWDAQPRDPAGSAVGIAEIAGLLGKARGINLLLLADCCYSGALQQVAKAAREAGNRAVAITSAAASNTSTDTWAYSMTVLDALAGRSLVDHDGDGKVDLGELAKEVRDTMKLREGQLAGTSYQGLSEEWVLTSNVERPETVGKLAIGFAVGQYVRVTVNGKSRVARVLGSHDDDYEVEYWSYSDRHRVTVEPSRLSTISFKRYAKGDSLDVLWSGQTYEATVLELDGDFHLITYPGWPAYWDEWVMSNRIVGIHSAADGAAQDRPPVPQVMVEWGGTWWPASVVKEEGDRFFIHYTGYEASWDEWVTKERIRFAK